MVAAAKRMARLMMQMSKFAKWVLYMYMYVYCYISMEINIFAHYC